MAIPVEQKQIILEDAKARILEGHTLAQIASTHGISSRTLQTWLHNLGDEYRVLRELWIDNMLIDASDEIDNAIESETDEGGANPDKGGKDRSRIDRANIRLALAREKWKKATWYAERRDSQRYGAKVEHKQDLSLSITVNRALPDTPAIEGDYVEITDKIRIGNSNTE